ncbi:MAG: hypothetical protein ACLFQY_05310, partial [Desulfococcaceae bacterium]
HIEQDPPGTDQFTTIVRDSSGNPVPDDTLISFSSTSGIPIPGSAQTLDGIASTTINNAPDGTTYAVTAKTTGASTTHVTSFAVESNIVFAGTNGGGIYKSTNAGINWENVTRDPTVPGQNWIDPYVNDVAIDPQDPNIVYAATGYSEKGGLYRSMNGGRTWDNGGSHLQGIIINEPISPVLSVLAFEVPKDPVLTDEDPALLESDVKICIGTEQDGIYCSGSEEDLFDSNVLSNRTVMDIEKAPGSNTLYAGTDSGVYKSENNGQNWSPTGSFSGNFVKTIAVHPPAIGQGDVIYAGTEGTGVWISTDSGNNWTQKISGLGEVIGATDPEPDAGNTGTGTMSAVEVFSEADSEEWTVILEEPQVFKVIGSATGELAQRYDIDQEEPYTIPGVLGFTITPGTVPFEIGDFFTFRTIRDEGTNIQDLLVDEKNNNLYAITIFDEFDHATGNVFVHRLNSNGTFGTGSWNPANQNLPEFNPPTDTTLFAQHAMAAIPDDSGDSTSPKALLIGGEGITLYKASSGLENGNPLWQSSQNGISNLIMTRAIWEPDENE